jgi:hypothetical protein
MSEILPAWVTYSIGAIWTLLGWLFFFPRGTVFPEKRQLVIEKHSYLSWIWIASSIYFSVFVLLLVPEKQTITEKLLLVSCALLMSFMGAWRGTLSYTKMWIAFTMASLGSVFLCALILK